MLLFFADLTVLLILVGIAYLLGFRLGSEDATDELARVRLEAARAERQIHDLTRQAFISMAEHVEEHRKDQSP